MSAKLDCRMWAKNVEVGMSCIQPAVMLHWDSLQQSAAAECRALTLPFQKEAQPGTEGYEPRGGLATTVYWDKVGLVVLMVAVEAMLVVVVGWMLVMVKVK